MARLNLDRPFSAHGGVLGCPHDRSIVGINDRHPSNGSSLLEGQACVIALASVYEAAGSVRHGRPEWSRKGINQSAEVGIHS
jgi:hypothetical protein